jgi:hypothetical protein
MKLIFQIPGLCMFGNEGLHYIQFIDAAGLETARIMKAEFWSAFKYHLVLDIMLSTLKRFSCYQELIKAPYLSGGREDGRIDLCKEEDLSAISFVV